MAENKWLKQLRKHDAAIDNEYDAFAPENCVYTPSPYINWIFANKSHGIPKGSGVLLFSDPKAGKSLLSQAIAGQLHEDDGEGYVMYFSTEFKGKYQKGFFDNIDPDRIIMYDTNDPRDIFDYLVDEVEPMVQDGFPLKMVIIDSLTAIGGIKAEGRSVGEHLIGDKALTITRGLDRVIPFFKKNNITYITVAQVRMNIGAFHGPDTKAAVPKACEHNHEFFLSVKRATAADDKKDITGQSFEGSVKDARGNKSVTGHKIYVKMEQSSVGTAGRAAKVTIDYKKGFINQHEEIFELGVNTGVIERPNNVTYVYDGENYKGKKAMAEAIKNDPGLAQKILDQVKESDRKLSEDKTEE
jgi:RecA/RadA recombinase